MTHRAGSDGLDPAGGLSAGEWRHGARLFGQRLHFQGLQIDPYVVRLSRVGVADRYPAAILGKAQIGGFRPFQAPFQFGEDLKLPELGRQHLALAVGPSRLAQVRGKLCRHRRQAGEPEECSQDVPQAGQTCASAKHPLHRFLTLQNVKPFRQECSTNRIEVATSTEGVHRTFTQRPPPFDASPKPSVPRMGDAGRPCNTP